MSDSSLAFMQFERFIQLWQGDTSVITEQLLHSDVEFISSHRGRISSLAQVSEHIKSEFPSHVRTEINVSNVVQKLSLSFSKISAYFYGQIHHQQGSYFGGMIILTFKHDLIVEVKIQMNWVEGNIQMLSHWILPLERLWKPNDPKATAIVSELDAIWHRLDQGQQLLPLFNDDDRIVEVWYRYAWGLDLADTSLYLDIFTDNAVVKLPPMGTLKGKREIISTLKAFRMPWPSIQHYGEPLHIEVNQDTATAQLMIGRIIPQQRIDNEGHPMYAAHYQIELHLSQSNQWKIHSMNYIPGWIRTQ